MDREERKKQIRERNKEYFRKLKNGEIPKERQINPLYLKFMEMTGNLSETLDLMDKWEDEHGIKPVGTINTNNHYEYELDMTRRKYFLELAEKKLKEEKEKK